MSSTSTSGPGADETGPAHYAPGACRVRSGTVELNADRSDDERREFVVVNTGDRPVQIGSHLHLADANGALLIRPAHGVPGAGQFDRDAARGFRLDIPAGTSQRFEPGASRTVAAVAFRGARRVPGIAMGKNDGEVL